MKSHNEILQENCAAESIKFQKENLIGKTALQKALHLIRKSYETIMQQTATNRTRKSRRGIKKHDISQENLSTAKKI
jgi:hypothetical protein